MQNFIRLMIKSEIFVSLLVLVSHQNIASAQSTQPVKPKRSFEQSYVALQEKLRSLEKKGEKFNRQAQQEIESLMLQMNHDHTQIKRELESKNQELNQRIAEGRRTIEEDWSTRIQRAYTEVSSGISRAWRQLQTPEPKQHPAAPAEFQ